MAIIERTPGDKYAHAKLTVEQVREIRRRYIPRRNRSALAREFHVTRQTIRNITRRTSWGWLDPIAVAAEDW